MEMVNPKGKDKTVSQRLGGNCAPVPVQVRALSTSNVCVMKCSLSSLALVLSVATALATFLTLASLDFDRLHAKEYARQFERLLLWREQQRPDYRYRSEA